MKGIEARSFETFLPHQTIKTIEMLSRRGSLRQDSILAEAPLGSYLGDFQCLPESEKLKLEMWPGDLRGTESASIDWIPTMCPVLSCGVGTENTYRIEQDAGTR